MDFKAANVLDESISNSYDEIYVAYHLTLFGTDQQGFGQQVLYLIFPPRKP